jgi:chorismate mutase
LKDTMGLEVYQPDREIEVLRHVRSQNGGPLDADAITRLFERIIDEARRLERAAQ